MSDEPPFPEIDVAVTVIARDDAILAVFNPRWGSFTLPMTKRREWHDPEVQDRVRREAWIEAAGRAAAEWLGVTSTGLVEIRAEFEEPYQQSDRDGVWKRYTFRAFRLDLESTQQPDSRALTEWLTVPEFLDPARHPISQTARYLVTKLHAAATGSGTTLP